MAGEIVPFRQKVETIRAMLAKLKPDLVAAIPRHLNADRLLQVAVTAIRRNPTLAECTPASLLGGIMQATQLGLQLDGVLGESYLVPFRNKGVLECQFIPGYKGLMKLAHQSDRISTIEARVVHANDKFSFSYGLKQHLSHTPTDGDPGDPTCVYAIARMKDGEVQFVVIPRREIEATRARSKARDSGPWVTDEEAMWQKTAARRLCKYLPASTDQMARAVALDERAEAGISQEIDVIDTEPDPPTASGGALDRLTDKLGGGPTSPLPPNTPAPPSAELTPLEKAWAHVRELAESKQVTDSHLDLHIKKTLKTTREHLGLLQVQTLGQYLSGLPDEPES